MGSPECEVNVDEAGSSKLPGGADTEASELESLEEYEDMKQALGSGGRTL